MRGEKEPGGDGRSLVVTQGKHSLGKFEEGNDERWKEAFDREGVEMLSGCR